MEASYADWPIKESDKKLLLKVHFPMNIKSCTHRDRRLIVAIDDSLS